MTLRTLVNASDLTVWANRWAAQVLLPRVLRRLVHATVERVERIGFPADEGVQLGGWDGVVRVDEGNNFVPDGLSAWELGTNRNVKAKADADYEKRVENPRSLNPSETAFIFVTPRRWGGKGDWEDTRREEGFWREVRVYDADDLEEWLELAHAVHVWLSILVGKHPEGAIDLSSFWAEWSEATSPPISADLAISGRRDVSERVRAWLREDSAGECRADPPRVPGRARL